MQFGREHGFSRNDLFVYSYVDRQQSHEYIAHTNLSLLTSLVQNFGQQWLRPIQDFSLPPDSIYNRLPGWQLLDIEDINLMGVYF